MELEKMIQGSTQDAAFLYIPIPEGLTAQGILLHLILEILRNLQGELTTDDGEVLTTNDGEFLTFDNREIYPEINLFYWRDRLVNGNYERQYVFIRKSDEQTL